MPATVVNIVVALPCSCIQHLFLSFRIWGSQRTSSKTVECLLALERGCAKEKNDSIASYDVSVFKVQKEKLMTALTTFSSDFGGLCRKFWLTGILWVFSLQFCLM